MPRRNLLVVVHLYFQSDVRVVASRPLHLLKDVVVQCRLYGVGFHCWPVKLGIIEKHVVLREGHCVLDRVVEDRREEIGLEEGLNRIHKIGIFKVSVLYNKGELYIGCNSYAFRFILAHPYICGSCQACRLPQGISVLIVFYIERGLIALIYTN